MDELLTVLAALELHLRDPAPADSMSDQTDHDTCWPAWRVLLHRTNDPGRFEAWWRGHASACAACQDTVRRVEAEGLPDDRQDRAPPAQLIPHLFDAACARAVRWAAATTASVVSWTAELPLVQYHRLRDCADPSIETTWCVTWDNSLFFVLVGPRQALEKWEAGASVLDSQGAHIADLKPTSADTAQLLAPPGAFDHESHTLCLQCQLSVGELRGSPVMVPQLLTRGIQLAPVQAATSLVQELIADLASRNRVARFLASLPEELADPQEAVTLCFYIRLLHRQGRLTPEDRTRLLELHWLTQDLREALRAATDAETQG